MALGAVLAGIGAAAASVSPLASGVPPFWQGVSVLNVQCQVATDAGMMTDGIADTLCRSVRDQAARGAPVPVQQLLIGDPAVLRPDAVTLLVHATLARGAGGITLAFYIRPYRTGEQASALLFGAMPRAVPLPGGRLTGASFDTALADMLRDTVPWQAERGGTRIIDR